MMPEPPKNIVSTSWVIAKAKMMIIKPTRAKVSLARAAAAASGLPDEVIN